MISVQSKEKWQGALYSLVVVLVGWWLVSWLFRLPIIPSPVAVFLNIADVFSTKMEVHVLYSPYCNLLAILIGPPLLIGLE